MRHLIVLVSLVVWPCTTSGRQLLREISWLKLQNQGKVTVGQVIEPNDTTAFEQLKVQNSQSEPKTFAILTIDNPGISASSYALTGKVRYEDVESVGYLEMWNYLDDGGRYFSRTLGDSGPMQSLRGSSDWRPFSVRFYIGDTTEARPFKLELNVVLPGRGTVYLSPLELVQYEQAESVSPGRVELWRNMRAGQRVLGAAAGLLGGLVGILTGLGKGRRLVLALLLIMFVSGLASMILSLLAISKSQPHTVFLPFLWYGIVCCILPIAIRRAVRRRFEEIELRKIKSMDVS